MFAPGKGNQPHQNHQPAENHPGEPIGKVVFTRLRKGHDSCLCQDKADQDRRKAGKPQGFRLQIMVFVQFEQFPDLQPKFHKGIAGSNILHSIGRKS